MRLKPLFAAVYLKFNPLAAALPLAPRLAPAALLRGVRGLAAAVYQHRPHIYGVLLKKQIRR